MQRAGSAGRYAGFAWGAPVATVLVAILPMIDESTLHGHAVRGE